MSTFGRPGALNVSRTTSKRGQAVKAKSCTSSAMKRTRTRSPGMSASSLRTPVAPTRPLTAFGSVSVTS